ncbi:polysaccharide deacetylase family protein [Hyphomicrobium sulfonivorans]|uniref:polysaccharide deacetylase family protein n=1 Tax=Hyphomicrobium sulfonivorans TaxID=121290 RepID=UPI0015703645|nr:polysaccharide deacetylase family protein [Hyphomicrobium sulfonivorans]NSL73065.1 polysaccharide deacetylase family protein [Hyphomicrobium sulfonivorans]
MIRRLSLTIAVCITAASLGTVAAKAEEACASPKGALGVERIVEIDPSTGPLFGGLTKYEQEPRFLRPKEVVLTFDDGPLPKFTKPILDTLDKFCTKATFFYVGRMAQAYPSMVKEVMDRGHTMGTHTWSHPMNMRALPLAKATDQIERGFAAVALAAGRPIAPFFRFPGLSDSGPMLTHMQERGIASFTVDVVSNDSYIASPQRLAARTIQQVEARNGGIVLFHDIKASTAAALPTILTELKKRGYKVVHLRSKTEFKPLPELTAELSKAIPEQPAGPKLVPFFAVTNLDTNSEPEVTTIEPDAKDRARTGKSTHPVDRAVAADTGSTDEDDSDAAPKPAQARAKAAAKKQKEYSVPSSLGEAIGGRW